jgi:hypothetical protein
VFCLPGRVVCKVPALAVAAMYGEVPEYKTSSLVPASCVAVGTDVEVSDIFHLWTIAYCRALRWGML